MRLVDADKIIFREIDEIGGEYEPYLGCSKSQIDSLPSVTPLSSKLEKNSKKLEKNFGELDCISRADVDAVIEQMRVKLKDGRMYILAEVVQDIIRELPSVTPQEPTTKNDPIDYCRAFKIACELLNGSVLYGVDADRIYEIMVAKDGVVSSDSYESYILNNLQELDRGQYASEPTTKNNLGVECIKKSDAINIIQDMHGLARADVISDAVNRIIELPSVTSQEPRWIPVSEKLPEAEYGESDSVLVCFENETQDVLYFNGGNWCYPTGETYISINHENSWHNKVTAWMPLPKSYSEVEE